MLNKIIINVPTSPSPPSPLNYKRQAVSKIQPLFKTTQHQATPKRPPKKSRNVRHRLGCCNPDCGGDAFERQHWRRLPLCPVPATGGVPHEEGQSHATPAAAAATEFDFEIPKGEFFDNSEMMEEGPGFHS